MLAELMHREGYGFTSLHFYLKSFSLPSGFTTIAFRAILLCASEQFHRCVIRGSAGVMAEYHNKTVMVKVMLDKARVSRGFTAPNSTRLSRSSKVDNRETCRPTLQAYPYKSKVVV